MNFSKKNNELVRQNEKNVKKSQKHDVNLQKNSTMYFQIGLILCLLATYFLMDMKFLTSEPLIIRDTGGDDIAEVFSENIEIYKERVERVKKEPRKEQRVISDLIKFVPDDFKQVEPLHEAITQVQNITDKPTNPIVLKKPVKEPVSISFVDQVPVFPGCEGLSTNSERKLCMSNKISKHIQSKFNTSLGEELGLSGKQKINVEFKIDKNGNVTDIRSRAIHSKLEKEAERVVSKIPKMKPGKQQNKNVSVLYNLPITFQIDN